METSYFDPGVPFEAYTPAELAHEDAYVGRVIEGPFKSFNVFSSIHQPYYYVLIFGRTTRIPDGLLEHYCDKYLVETAFKCYNCGHVLRDKVAPDTLLNCPECDGYMHDIDVVKNRYKYFGDRVGFKVTDQRYIDICTKARNSPRNLDKNGHSLIRPFETFRIGTYLFYFDPWKVCYMQINNPEKGEY